MDDNVKLQESDNAEIPPVVGESASPPPKTQNSGFIKTLFAATLVNLCLTCSLIALYDYFFVPKIVTFDITGFITAQRDLYIAGKLTSEQLRGNFDVLENNFLKLRNNEVVLNAESVLRNGKTLNIEQSK